ncbi:MAG: glutamate 5-kinase [Firmicutes bacterium]|nr:glutamate 5-kinase [Bacillota bacterium]
MRLVVKVGSSTLTHSTGMLNIRLVEKLCKVLSDIKNSGHDVVLVSSGAVAMGVGKLNLRERPSDTQTKQAAAAVGQCELMYTYDKLFGEFNHNVAQILLTGNDISSANRENIENTLNRLLELGAMPIINENDTVSTAELEALNVLGDNDTLAAIVAVFVKADMLVLLSDIDGMYTADPRTNPDAELIHRIPKLTEEIIQSAGGSGTSQGTGGMVTKLNAAKIACSKGIDMVIANGDRPENLYDILDGKEVGTYFVGRKKRLEARRGNCN